MLYYLSLRIYTQVDLSYKTNKALLFLSLTVNTFYLNMDEKLENSPKQIPESANSISNIGFCSRNNFEKKRTSNKNIIRWIPQLFGQRELIKYINQSAQSNNPSGKQNSFLYLFDQFADGFFILFCSWCFRLHYISNLLSPLFKWKAFPTTPCGTNKKHINFHLSAFKAEDHDWFY